LAAAWSSAAWARSSGNAAISNAFRSSSPVALAAHQRRASEFAQGEDCPAGCRRVGLEDPTLKLTVHNPLRD
jgi:hypothetical protein